MTKRIVFIADQFANEFIGGAELSLQTHIDACPYEYIKVKSIDLDLKKLNKQKDLLVFGNFKNVWVGTMNSIIASKDWNYVVIESDYKYCQYQSPQIHKDVDDTECDCELTARGMRVADFMFNAKHLFWKSIGQRDFYYNKFPKLIDKPHTIISGVFSDEDLDFIISLRGMPSDNKYFILDNDNWIKGRNNAIEFCTNHDLPIRLVSKLSHRQILVEMAKSAGMVFLPNGFDTACRMVTEAKLIGLDLIINDLVQHATEDWFNSDLETMLNFLRSRNKEFWRVIGNICKN